MDLDANPFKEAKIGDMKLGDMKMGNLGNSSLNNSVMRAMSGKKAQESFYPVANTSFFYENSGNANRRKLTPFNALSLEFRDQDLQSGA